MMNNLSSVSAGSKDQSRLRATAFDGTAICGERGGMANADQMPTYHESLRNVTPTDAYKAILVQHARIKGTTIEHRRLRHRKIDA